MKYIKNEFNGNISSVNSIASRFKLTKTFAKILVSRGIDTIDKVKKFFYPSDNDFYNPFLLKDMEAVCVRIHRAVKERERILIFGDYDADGINAAYILETAITDHGGIVNHFLPHRADDGYGLTESSIEFCVREFKPNLIITVDCGISCYKEVEIIKNLGIDCVITDHHTIPEILPDCLIINPKLEGQNYPFSGLCGAGVSFKVVSALYGLEYAKKFLCAAAVATVADIVPLVDENRVIVKMGIERMRDLPLGVKMLAKSLWISKLTSQDISFKLAPKINAPGRMKNAELAMRLYQEKNETKIKEILKEIDELNTTRKDFGSQIFEDCEKEIKTQNLSQTRSLVLKNTDWEQGILGIVSAKITGEFNRPSVLFTNIGDILKGSGRSIRGINIMEALDVCNEQGLIENYGGHDLAAGLAIKPENFERFKEVFEDFCSRDEFDAAFETRREFVETITVKDLTMEFAKELSLLEPTGSENKPPIFKLDFKECSAIQNKAKANYIFVNLTDTNIKLVCFNGVSYLSALNSNCLKQALVEVGINTYQNKQEIRADVKSFNFLFFSEDAENDLAVKLLQLLELQNAENKTHNCSEHLNLNELDKKINIKKKFGNLFITYNTKTAVSFARKSNLSMFKYNLTDINGESAILICPEDFDDLLNYKNIIFLEPPLNDNFLNFTYEKTKANILVVKQQNGLNKISEKLNLSRNKMGEVFNIIKREYLNKNSFHTSILNFYTKTKAFKNKDINLSQFLFSVCVFSELGFLRQVQEPANFYIEIIDNVKRELKESITYRKFTELNNGN